MSVTPIRWVTWCPQPPPGCILRHRLDAVLHSSLSGIAFAGADDLVVLGFQDEVVFALFVFASIELLSIGGVVLDGCDSLFGRGL